MNLSLAHFLTTDHLRLPGLLYEPTKKTKQAAIYLHGCGSSSIFYKPSINLWGEEFTKHGISFFPFNNRGAHLIKSLHKETEEVESERVIAGTYYERIEDCLHDIDGALAFLKEQGYSTFYLIGHSTGANKIVVYNHLKQNNPISKYILLAGGDDTGLNYDMLGERRFKTALNRAKDEIAQGHEMKSVPGYLYPEPYSYRALYDLLNPNGQYNTFPFYEYLNQKKLSDKPLFWMYKKITKPTLIVYGEQDEFCYDNVTSCVAALKKHTNPLANAKFKILPETGHGFDGKEKVLADLLTNWVQS